MPFRHLLFNRRNGAPQRAPDVQPISLDSARFFSLDAEFPAYRWSEDDQPGPAGYNSALMRDPHPVGQSFDQSNRHLHNPGAETSYQSTLYDPDSKSVSYPDMMDTDASSISRGSIKSSFSSTSHLEIMFDTDSSSLDSTSRKASAASQFAPEAASQGLCPLLTGQVGQCSPSICGPDAPCLQDVNANYVPPIEQCIPETSRDTHLSGPYQTSDRPPPPPPQRQRTGTMTILNTAIDTIEPRQITPTDSESKKSFHEQSSNASMTELPVKSQIQGTQHTRKSRARQAHSLVERKYRENLNAKIQELHLTLKRAHFGKPRSLSATSAHPSHPDDDEDGGADEMTDTEKTYKVKKSDVLIEAMDYVHATEREMHRMQEEIKQLKSHIRTMEGWMRADQMNQQMVMNNLNQANNG